MTSTLIKLSDDPGCSESQMLRAITDAYSLTPAWMGDGDERAAIERDIRSAKDTLGDGLSMEFRRWEPVTASAGVVWSIDDYGYMRVTY